MFKLKRIFSGFILIAVELIYWLTQVFDIRYLCRQRTALIKYQGILNWVKTQNLPLDTSEALKLPDNLLGITHDDLVQVLHSSDDRHYIDTMW